VLDDGNDIEQGTPVRRSAKAKPTLVTDRRAITSPIEKQCRTLRLPSTNLETVAAQRPATKISGTIPREFQFHRDKHADTTLGDAASIHSSHNRRITYQASRRTQRLRLFNNAQYTLPSIQLAASGNLSILAILTSPVIRGFKERLLLERWIKSL